MKWSEIGLILLAVSAIAGLFSVVTGEQPVVQVQEEIPQETDPLQLLERDISVVCYGSGFREVPSASPDTIVRSMDLLDTVSVHQANLYITRTFREHGYDHVITYSDPGRGLSFLCHTPDGEPLRFELYDVDR